MGRRFATLDVFTDTPLAGNPLAVVLDAQGLDGAAMQAVAREFNLSETVFVLPPDEPRHRARLRIFTPVRELPFAGHPTIGTAILLALRDRGKGEGADAVMFGLEEGVGTVACVVELGPGQAHVHHHAHARFKAPVLPAWLGEAADAGALAGALGLAAHEVGFARHAPSRHGSGGPTFTFVPVASVAALDGARLDMAAFAALPGGGTDALYLYALEPEAMGRSYRTRMFAPHLGVPEDPATGSAAAAFAGVLTQFEPLGEGTHDIGLRQGVAMGRPSGIALQLVIAEGALRSVEIGGGAVLVAEGTLHV